MLADVAKPCSNTCTREKKFLVASRRDARLASRKAYRELRDAMKCTVSLIGPILLAQLKWINVETFFHENAERSVLVSIEFLRD